MRTIYLKRFNKDKDKNLGPDGTIRFQFSKRQYIDIHLDPNERPQIKIFGKDTINIVPSAANSIIIKID